MKKAVASLLLWLLPAIAVAEPKGCDRMSVTQGGTKTVTITNSTSASSGQQLGAGSIFVFDNTHATQSIYCKIDADDNVAAGTTDIYLPAGKSRCVRHEAGGDALYVSCICTGCAADTAVISVMSGR